ncbi:MAG: purine-nucleoside phosphorylase, partial [Rubrivivax sp.]
MTSTPEAIEQSAARLRSSGIAPKIAVVLGTGWGPVAERVQGAVDIPYRELPAFPVLGVGGHAGQVRLGTLGGQPVA